MSRRQIVTAREQFELLSPWRVAAQRLYRGYHVNLPDEIHQAILRKDPLAGHQVLDWLSSESKSPSGWKMPPGLGDHWTSEPSTAIDYAAPGYRTTHGVVLEGVPSEHIDPNQQYQAENEFTEQGGPVNVTGVHAWHRDTPSGEPSELIPLGGRSRRTAMANDYYGQPQAEEYWGQHRPPGPHYGSPLHDVTHDANGEEFLPEDIYDQRAHQLYGGDRRNFDIMRQVRGNPEAMVTMYRSLPQGHTHFRTGDWVALTPEIASSENIDPDDPAKDLPVIKAQVPAKHLWQNGDSFDEWGYHGPKVQGQITKVRPLATAADAYS